MAGQKAAIAAEALPHFEEEAAKRRKETEGRPSKLEEKIPQDNREAQSRDHAAATVGVNPRYVSDAKKIKEASAETRKKPARPFLAQGGVCLVDCLLLPQD